MTPTGGGVTPTGGGVTPTGGGVTPTGGGVTPGAPGLAGPPLRSSDPPAGASVEPTLSDLMAPDEPLARPSPGTAFCATAPGAALRPAAATLGAALASVLR